ncbi:CPBP family intramembrane metalloprotease [candidate division KSB1 bacterium]|nr:CPBP family intramembrane metalloprotease [candidate division KSB1 bacterium]
MILDREEKRTAYPDLKESWVILAITVLAAIALNVLILILYFIVSKVGPPGLSQTIVGHSLTMLLSYVALFAVVIWIAVRKKVRVEGRFAPDCSLPSPVSMLLIVLATLAIYFLVDPLVDLIPMPAFIERLFLQLLGDQNVWMIITVVIAAPICEELLVRGIMLDGLLKIYPPGKAIFWSAIFFGLFHLNPWQFIPALALGLFMGWIYYRSRSLMVTIVIHFIANGTGAVLGYFIPTGADEMITTRELIGNNFLYVVCLAAALLLATLSLIILNKRQTL